jgi:tetratricopeptide (TPR) repeat protein
MQVHCPGPESQNGRDITVVDHVKLFRNRPDLRFEHRIHEQILPAIRRAGGEVDFTSLYVIHSGADHTDEGRQRKIERDFKLLHLDLAERPDHPFVLFNLGMTYADTRQFDEAVKSLKRCLEVSRPEESHVRKAYALLLSALHQQSRLEEAEAYCRDARQLYPADKEILFRQAMLEHERKDFGKAAATYLMVLEPSAERHFTSIDVGLAGFKARHNLALVYDDDGRSEMAEEQWRLILSEHEDYRPAQIGIIDCLIRQAKLTEALPAVAKLAQAAIKDADCYRVMSRLAESRLQLSEAARLLETGLQLYPNSPMLLRELARLHYSVGDFDSSRSLLEQLTAAAPADSTAWRNLGVVLTQLDRSDEANMAFERATAGSLAGHEMS